MAATAMCLHARRSVSTSSASSSDHETNMKDMVRDGSVVMVVVSHFFGFVGMFA